MSVKTPKKTTKAKAKKPAKTKKKTPEIFKTKKVEIWENNSVSGEHFRINTLSSLELRYTATLLKTLTANIELLIESRLVDDADYCENLAADLRLKYADLQAFLKERNVVS